MNDRLRSAAQPQVGKENAKPHYRNILSPSTLHKVGNQGFATLSGNRPLSTVIQVKNENEEKNWNYDQTERLSKLGENNRVGSRMEGDS